MHKKDLPQLPPKPGIYIFKNNKGHILYIGKAKNLQKRVSQYFSPGSVWKQDMINKAHTLEFFVVQNETEALNLEENLIKQHRPPFNNLLKDNNRYVYIKFTKDDYPLIYITKRKINDEATYIGPKYHNKELRNLLQYFRLILKYRTCKNTQFKQKKLCSDYYFGLCKGRCISQKDNSNTKEYQQIIETIKDFFNGNSKPLQEILKNEINISAQNHNFERANKLKNIYLQIDHINEQQSTTLPNNISGYLYKIINTNNTWIYIILHFYEGKLIDIITHHQKIQDIELSSLINSINLEFSTQKKLRYRYYHKQKNNITIGSINIPLTKDLIDKTQDLFDNFIDSYIAKTSFQDNSILNDILKDLQERYKLKKLPYHIECIDISHIGGDYISGGLSCFIGGIANYKYYRKYKIKHPSNDDYEAIKELLTRRFSNNNFLPDLFIIDGGKGQLNVLKKLIKTNHTIKQIVSKVDFISLGKGSARSRKGKQKGNNEKIYYLDNNFNIHNKALIYDQVDRILIQIRDEAHRFANSYRKQQMSKEWK